MTADDAIVTCTCGKEHRYDTDPHEWKPTMALPDPARHKTTHAASCWHCSAKPGERHHRECPAYGERIVAAPKPALDADTLRDLIVTLRREIGPETDRDRYWQPMISAAEVRTLLDAAEAVERYNNDRKRLSATLLHVEAERNEYREAVERIRTLADEFRESTNPWVVYVIEGLRAALDPPPDRNHP